MFIKLYNQKDFVKLLQDCPFHMNTIKVWCSTLDSKEGKEKLGLNFQMAREKDQFAAAHSIHNAGVATFSTICSCTLYTQCRCGHI